VLAEGGLNCGKVHRPVLLDRGCLHDPPPA
jgi:hypothetical protein